MVFGNTNNGAGYDIVLLGQVEPTRIDVDDDRRSGSSEPEYAPVAQSLREIGFNSAIDLFATYAGRRPISRRGSRTRRSTAIATCGCSISPAWA